MPLQTCYRFYKKLHMGFFNHIPSHNIKKISNTSKGIHIISKLQCTVIFFLPYHLAVQEMYLGFKFLISFSTSSQNTVYQEDSFVPLSFPPKLHPSLFQFIPLPGIPVLASRELTAHNNISVLCHRFKFICLSDVTQFE